MARKVAKRRKRPAKAQPKEHELVRIGRQLCAIANAPGPMPPDAIEVARWKTRVQRFFEKNAPCEKPWERIATGGYWVHDSGFLNEMLGALLAYFDEFGDE